MDRFWLGQCTPTNRLKYPRHRDIHILPQHIVKIKPQTGGGSSASEDEDDAELTRLARGYENELLALKLVRAYTSVPVPRVIHEGDGFVVFERLQGQCGERLDIWNLVSPENKELIKLQVRGWIEQMARRILNSSGQIRSLVPSGELLHTMFAEQNPGPFASTVLFLNAYNGVSGMPQLHKIKTRSHAVFSHMDLSLANVIIHPDLHKAIGLVNWEQACFFPEGGRSVHKSYRHGKGWESLFDSLDFPVLETTSRWDDNLFSDED
ncbi:MAG: hypothetical protein M1837_001624 [Sclerophora amabilis]|nr:MAG: hypothetical protein M1837_001624 [Sclerophora amabilis]